MFMISASSTLAAIIASVLALSTVVDNEHRIRPERMTDRSIWIWRFRDKQISRVKNSVLFLYRNGKTKLASKAQTRELRNTDDERQPLLG